MSRPFRSPSKSTNPAGPASSTPRAPAWALIPLQLLTAHDFGVAPRELATQIRADEASDDSLGVSRDPGGGRHTGFSWRDETGIGPRCQQDGKI